MADNQDLTPVNLQQMSFEDLLYCARICDQIEKFDWMLLYVNELLNKDQMLGFDERNLVSVAFKNYIGPERTSWRICESVLKREKGKNAMAQSESQIQHVQRIKKDCEKRVEKTCQEIIEKIEKKMMTKEESPLATIFYLKMKADYYRYMAEFQVETLNVQDKIEIPSVQNALEAYKKAQELAKDKLDTTDPVRLGLDLNFSVFYYEIMKDPKMACDIAKRSFDDAIYDIENIADKNYKDSTTIMQLMRDNLNLWSSELEEGLESSSDEGMQ